MSEYVTETQRRVLQLISHEMRAGDQDTPSAMRRVARKCGMTYGALWSLRYRAPRDVLASVYFKVAQMHEAMCEQQRRKLEHELLIAEARGSDEVITRAARRIGGVDRDRG